MKTVPLAWKDFVTISGAVIDELTIYDLSEIVCTVVECMNLLTDTLFTIAQFLHSLS